MENWNLTPAHNIGQPMSEQLKSARRENGLMGAIAHLAWYFGVTVSLKVFHRLNVDGRDNLPVSGPFVLVSNHASHLDALILASAVSWRMQNKVFPVAAGDTFFSSRFNGTLSSLVINALPMWRNRACSHGLADLRERLIEDRCIYIIFPEGTRTRTGEMTRFRAGLGMLLAGSNVPVVPCFISGAFNALPSHRRFPRPAKLRLRIGQPVLQEGLTNDRQGWEMLTGTIEAAIIAMRDGTDCQTRS